MKFKKKLYAAVLTGAVLLSAGSMTTFAASGHDDSKFQFGFNGFETEYTGVRWKYESTPLFIYLKDISGSRSAFTASAVDGDYGNFSYTSHNRIDRSDINKYNYINSNAYEDRQITDVRIKAVSGSPHAFIASGLWSPDSY